MLLNRNQEKLKIETDKALPLTQQLIKMGKS